jgi:hypothetical protein
MCFHQLNYPVSNTSSTALLTNRRKIRQQEFHSELVFVHKEKDKDLLLKKNPMCSTQYFRLVASFIYYSNRVLLRKVTTRHYTEEY